jgi:hypothetical protein
MQFGAMRILPVESNHANVSMKSKKLALAAAIAIALLAIATYASPHWQLYRMRAAVEARDTEKLAGFVDFPALRESVKLQVMQRLGAGAGPSEGKSNPFAAFGKAMALAVLDPVVDAAVSPAGVAAMLERGDVKLKTGRANPASGEPTREKVNYDLSYQGWDRVSVAKADGSGAAFILRRDGLWGWKLSGVELPRD